MLVVVKLRQWIPVFCSGL